MFGFHIEAESSIVFLILALFLDVATYSTPHYTFILTLHNSKINGFYYVRKCLTVIDG